MKASKSFQRLVQTLRPEKGEFDDWPMEELAMRLRDDGVDIPPDVNPFDLVSFAEAFYEGRQERPRRYSVVEPEFIDANGVAYIPRPKHRKHKARIIATADEGNVEQPPTPVVLGGTFGANEVQEPYRQVLEDPPMFPSEMTDYELQNMQDFSLDDLGAVEVVEEDDPRVHGEAPEMAEIRENFRFLEAEEATEARIKNEFQRPSIEVAKRFANLTHPRKADGARYSVFWTNTGRFCFRGRRCLNLFDPFGEGSTSELAKYGVGVSLYFKTLKWLFWVFFFMSLCVLPQMVINAQGGARPKSLFTLDSTTLGHLTDLSFYVNETVVIDQSSNNQTNATIVRVFDNAPVLLPMTDCGGKLCSVSRPTLALWYMVMDLAAIGIFFVALRWLQYFTNMEGSRITKHHITVEEYTIQVVKVPADITEFQLKKFFSELTGEPVHDVFLVQDNGELLNLYVKRGKVINKLWKQAATVHLLKEERKAKPGVHAIKDDKVLLKKLERAIKRYDTTYAHFLNINEQRARMNPGTKSLSAFVTFETQQGFLKALDLYPQGYFNKRKQPPELRLDEKPLRVRQAPPPTTILWENTHYRWSSRRWRRVVTMFGTLLALALTVVVCFFTERERNRLKRSIFTEECTLIRSIQEGLFNQTFATNMTELASVLQEIENENPEAIELAKENDLLRNCYCSSMNYGEAAAAVFTSASLCHAFYVEKSPLYVLTFFATLVISGVNIVIQNVIVFLSKFEKHHSVVNMELSIAKRVFVVMTINTGFILLAVNAAFPGAQWVGSGLYEDFSPDWYASVGTSLMLTMIFNIFTPHLYPLLNLWRFEVRKRTRLAYSQRELNEMYLGPNFFLSYRCAQLLMTLFVSLVYSAGIPAMYPLAAAMFAVAFYMDKFLLFNYYRTPPSYSEKMSNWFVSTMSYAVIGHLAFAAWMLSAKGIFWDGTSIDTSHLATYFGLDTRIDDGSFDFTRRLSQTHVLPLYIVFLLMVFFKVFGFCFKCFDRVRLLLCATVTCGIFDDGTIKRRYLNPDYTEAVENGELRGLVTYNMLENPTYARALGIDGKFAKEHRHIASVHEASAVDLPNLPKSFKITPLEETERKRESRKRDSKKQRSDSIDSAHSSRRGPAEDDEEAQNISSRPLSLSSQQQQQLQRRSQVIPAGGEDLEAGRERGGSRHSARLANAFRVESLDERRASRTRPRTESNASTTRRESLARAFDVSRDDFY